MSEDEADMLPRLAVAVRERIEKALPADPDPQVHDVARRFALVAVAVAGEIATAWNILPWPRDEATRAAQAMLAAWLGRRGGVGASEEAQHLRAIRLFLTEHGSSRFVVLHQNDAGGWHETYPERPVARRAGWQRKDAKGQELYLIPPVVWREVCGEAGVDPTEAAKTLCGASLVDLGDGKNLTATVRIPGRVATASMPGLWAMPRARTIQNELAAPASAVRAFTRKQSDGWPTASHT